MMLLLPLFGCTNNHAPPTSAAPALSNTDVISQIREVDLSARSTSPARSMGGISGDATPQPQIYYGSGAPGFATNESQKQTADENDPATTGALPPPTAGNADDKGYEMNFENTPVATVAKVVLGDILHVGYTIDSHVQGTVTLASGRPVRRKDLLYVLESALRVSNVALVRDGTAYRLIPANEAPGSGAIDAAQGREPGYGITVVPLQFVSAATLAKLLENFAAKPGMIRADQSRNLVVIQGNAADRQTAFDTVRDFDADWMRGQSVGIFPVTNSTPEPVIAELEKIVDAGEGGLSQDLVKLQAVARQNAVLAVTRKPGLLKTIATWVARLDKAGTAGTSVRVYRMRFGDAKEVAGLLNEVFTGSGDSGLDSPTNDLVPGAGGISTSSGRPNLSGTPQASGIPQIGSGTAQPPGGGSQPNPQYAANSTFGGPSTGKLGQGGLAQSSSPNPGRYRGDPTSMGTGGPPLLPGVRIAADVVNNALLIYSNQENYRIIERTLMQLDRPRLQVAIDATIAEVTLNDALSYGVQFFLQSRNLGLAPNVGSIANNPIPNTAPLPTNSTTTGTTTTNGSNDPITAASSAVLSRVLPGFNFLVGSEFSPQAILDALHSVTSVKIVSTPSVVAIDNTPATLLVGDQIPITTQTAISVQAAGAPVVNNIDYRNTGVILHVAPRINANGNILLDIEQEISTVANNANALTLTPTVSQRIVKSSIAVANGQTVLLAGLISETQNNNSNGIPGLDQVPGLGILFSQNNKTVQRDELIIFIRPQIIRNGNDARRIAEELRAKMIGTLHPPSQTLPCCVK
jgi:general secretion pathway protein D